MPIPEGKGGKPADFINWEWSLADIDRVQVMVQRRASANEIAHHFGCGPGAVRALCKRNDFDLWTLPKRVRVRS